MPVFNWFLAALFAMGLCAVAICVPFLLGAGGLGWN